VNGTRNHPDVYLGASPRGSIALYRAGQALAGLLGRDYVIPDDIKALAEAAARASADHQDELVDPRRPARPDRPRAARDDVGRHRGCGRRPKRGASRGPARGSRILTD